MDDADMTAAPDVAEAEESKEAAAEEEARAKEVPGNSHPIL